VDPRRGRGAEQGHLELPVFLELVAVVPGHGLPDHEADLLAPVVDPLPLRGRAVAGQVGGEVEGGRLQVGTVDEQPHLGQPRHHDQDRSDPREPAGHGTDEDHDWKL
jgi:hypothetical protein